MPPAPTPPGPTLTATGSEFRLSWIDHPALPAHGLGLCRCPGSRDGVRVPPSLLAQDLGHLAGLDCWVVGHAVNRLERRDRQVSKVATNRVEGVKDLPNSLLAYRRQTAANAFQELRGSRPSAAQVKVGSRWAAASAQS